jgi:SAM-dependent methyltransferase
MKVCGACGQRFNASDWRCPTCAHHPESHGGYLAFSPNSAKSNDGFSAEYFTQLVFLEGGNFWFEARNRLLIWCLRRYFPRASTFFEIGCGTGFVLSGVQREFPEIALTGSEIFYTGLDIARKRLPGVTLYQMDVHRIPFEDEFDVIGAFDVLEHIQEDEAILLQMFKASKNGGGIIVTVPQHHFLWSPVDEYSCHKRRYTRRELTEKVERAGFEIIRSTSFVFFLLPLMLLFRMRQRRSLDHFDPLAEFKISSLFNGALQRVMDMERIIIRSGISFPAGGSLLMIAKRKRG